jgi:VWFA-related protein
MTSHVHVGWGRGVLAVAAALGAASPIPTRAVVAQEHVYVTVVDKKGQPVMDLGAADFVVQIDDSAQEVLGAKPATLAPSIVLLTDRLGLNATYTPLDLRQALGDFVKVIRAGSPDSRFALTTFDGPVVQITKFTSAPAELDRALGRLSSLAPEAALLDALTDACQQMSAAPTERRMIFTVLAAYRSEASTVNTEIVGEQLRASKASLWAVEVRRAEGDNYSHAGREQVLDAGSRLSGGLRDTVSSRSGLGSASKRFAQLMLAQYDVTYGPAGGTARSRLTVGVKRPGLRVLAPAWISR